MRKILTASTLVLALAWAAPAAAQIGFGGSAAVGDSEVFIGEPGNTIEPGIVYVYRQGAGGWEETARLMASNATDHDGFGAAIAVDGDSLVITAENSGAVYFFRRVDDRWVEETFAAPTPRGGFGASAAISGNVAVVGAPTAADGTGNLFVFERGDDGWREIGRLAGDGYDQPAPGAEPAEGERVPERFGSTVAIDGDWILVGAPGPADDLFLLGALGLNRPTGSAYLFHRQEGAWERSEKLMAPIGGEAAVFGYSVSLHDGNALVGAIGADNLSGVVHAFANPPGSSDWSWVARLLAFDAFPATFFGAAIAQTDDTVLVGAPGAGNLAGRVYRFRHVDNELVAAEKVDTVGLKWGSAYGTTLAARGDVIAAGLPGDDFGAGTAVIMDRMSDGWSRTRLLTEARGLDAITDGGIECVDGMAGPFECDNIDLVAFLPVHAMGGGRGVTTNDMWGWTDPETGRDYAIVGMRDGTAFVDVTEPASPVFVGKLPKTGVSPASLWRDIKVYGDHAFIVADSSGEHGVQVFDLTRVREFNGTPITFTQAAHYDRVASSHNININEDTAFAYAVGNSGGGESCGGGLHMINVEDPREPVFAGCFQHMNTGTNGIGSMHDVQCVTYGGPDERYQGQEICFGSNETALSIADVTDKRNPTAIGMATYPNLAYTHQGWLDEEQRYFYMNDEGDEVAGLTTGTRTLIWDVADLEDPILVGEHVSDNPATDHNLYIRGDRMYQSNYRSGLHVYDISDRENPTPIGFFDTVPWGEDDGMGDIISGAIGSWSNYPFFDSGIVAVTSGKEGLFILRVRE